MNHIEKTNEGFLIKTNSLNINHIEELIIRKLISEKKTMPCIADETGINERTLYRKTKEYNIKRISKQELDAIEFLKTKGYKVTFEK
jgi:DNA-binding NtrC family response regulator